MDNWINLTGFLIILYAISILMYYSSSTLNQSRSLVLVISGYLSLFMMILISLITIWHFHFIWGDIIHYHPDEHLRSITIIEILNYNIDLYLVLTILISLPFYFITLMYNQYHLRDFDNQISLTKNSGLTSYVNSLIETESHINIIVINENSPRAFSYSLICKFKKVSDQVVITSKLISLLTEDELKTVIYHEISHCINQDTRYAHLLETLSSILRFDPLLKVLVKRMEKSQELKADEHAVKITKRPRDLAKALYKLLEHNFNSEGTIRSFTGGSYNFIIFRIERLLSMEPTNTLI